MTDSTPDFDAAVDAVLADWEARYAHGEPGYEPDPSHKGIIRQALETALPHLHAAARRQERERCAAAFDGYVNAAKEMRRTHLAQVAINLQQTIRALPDEDTPAAEPGAAPTSYAWETPTVPDDA